MCAVVQVLLEEFEDFGGSMTQLNEQSVACNIVPRLPEPSWHMPGKHSELSAAANLQSYLF